MQSLRVENRTGAGVGWGRGWQAGRCETRSCLCLLSPQVEAAALSPPPPPHPPQPQRHPPSRKVLFQGRQELQRQPAHPNGAAGQPQAGLRAGGPLGRLGTPWLSLAANTPKTQRSLSPELPLSSWMAWSEGPALSCFLLHHPHPFTPPPPPQPVSEAPRPPSQGLEPSPGPQSVG